MTPDRSLVLQRFEGPTQLRSGETEAQPSARARKAAGRPGSYLPATMKALSAASASSRSTMSGIATTHRLPNWLTNRRDWNYIYSIRSSLAMNPSKPNSSPLIGREWSEIASTLRAEAHGTHNGDTHAHPSQSSRHRPSPFPSPAPTSCSRSAGVYCIGRNYAAHTIEMRRGRPRSRGAFLLPEEPRQSQCIGRVSLIRPSPATCITRRSLRSCSKSGGVNIPVDGALDHVYGLCARPGHDPP